MSYRLVLSLVCLALGCGGEVGDVGAEDSSDSVLAKNGVALNGVALNGVALNGVALNGVALNGVALNGVALNGSELIGSLGSTPIAGTAFVNAHLGGTLSSGVPVTLRITRVQQDQDPDIWLYWLQALANGTSTNLCVDTWGTQQPAIAVAGRWRTDGSKDKTAGYFTFACRQIGAIAKCVDLHYKPWRTVGGISLDDTHQACVRMIRADYCGDGHSYTTNGRTIDVYDAFGIQRDDTANYSQCIWRLDAEWTPAGARCMATWRNASLPTPPSCYYAKYSSYCGQFGSGALIIDKSATSASSGYLTSSSTSSLCTSSSVGGSSVASCSGGPCQSSTSTTVTTN